MRTRLLPVDIVSLVVFIFKEKSRYTSTGTFDNKIMFHVLFFCLAATESDLFCYNGNVFGHVYSESLVSQNHIKVRSCKRCKRYNFFFSADFMHGMVFFSILFA